MRSININELRHAIPRYSNTIAQRQPQYPGRAILVCGRLRFFGIIRLFARSGAYKLRLQLGGLPDICEPMPSKPKWTRRKTYRRIRNEIQALEAQAKTRRFKKPLSTQLFAYHVG
jgi:hypothetical protein